MTDEVRPPAGGEQNPAGRLQVRGRGRVKDGDGAPSVCGVHGLLA